MAKERSIKKSIIILTVLMFTTLTFSGCSALAFLTKKSTNPNAPSDMKPAVSISTAQPKVSNKVTIEVKTYNEPNLAKILKSLNGIYGNPIISFDGFRDKTGRFIITKKLKYYKNETVIAEVTIFDGEIVSIVGDRFDPVDGADIAN